MKLLLSILNKLALLSIGSCLVYWAGMNWYKLEFAIDTNFLSYEGNAYCFLSLFGLGLVGAFFIDLFRLTFFKKEYSFYGEGFTLKAIITMKFKGCLSGLLIILLGYVGLRRGYLRDGPITPEAAYFIIFIGFCGFFYALLKEFHKE